MVQEVVENQFNTDTFIGWRIPGLARHHQSSALSGYHCFVIPFLVAVALTIYCLI